MHKRILSSVFCFFICATICTADTFINLGPQVTATTIQGSEFLRDNSGRDLIYTVERGSPGHVLGYDVASGQKVVDLPMPGGCDGAWEAASSSDGWLFTSGGNGHMFRHKPGTQTIEDLGQAPPAEKVVWDVTPGENGEMFGGTYPGCRVVRYNPHAGFSDAGRGPLVPGENYVRCLVYYHPTRKIYAGVGSHAHLIELDPDTGAKKEILSAQTHGQEAVYSLQIVLDEKTGDRLFIWLTNSNQTLIYNLRTQKLERSLPTTAVKAVKKSPTSQTVYFNNDDELMSLDLDRPSVPPRKMGRCIGMLASRWVDADHLCVLTRYAQLITYNIHTGTAETKSLPLPSQPIPIQSLALGPDGKMWMGGFLAGGTTKFDPITSTSHEYRGMSQIETMGQLDQQMYLGVYPHGRLYQFDPTLPWSTANPRKVGQIAGQSRPIALLGVPELGKVYIGTVPEYGALGGRLIVYDPHTHIVEDRGEIVPRQSIVSLAYTNNILIGGTSITGGLGIESSEHGALLFGWSPRSAKKTFAIAPVPGALAITCLIHGPDGNIWGIADGTLFIFDPTTQKILLTHHLIDVHYDSRHIWRDAFLLLHPSGQLYGVIDGRFFRLDPATKNVTILRSHAVLLLAMDRAANFYFCDPVNLWKYIP